jgi:hypothetical protein
MYIYNINGRLLDEIKTPENYSVHHLKSGVYLVKIKNNNIEETKTLIIK